MTHTYSALYPYLGIKAKKNPFFFEGGGMQSCVLKVISVLFYCLFLKYSGMTMATEIIHLFFKNSFVVHSFVIFCCFTSMFMVP